MEETPSRRDPSPAESLARTLTELGEQIDKVREDVTAAADRRTRVLTYLLCVVAFIALLATGAALLAHIRLGGALADVHEQQLSACGFHRGWVEIPAAAASAQAAASPGTTRSPNPYLDALTALSATAYNLGGCVPRHGELKQPYPTPTTSPTPSG